MEKKFQLPERTKIVSNSILDFTLGPVIGDGAFAKVRRATHNPTGKTYAIKIIHLSSMENGDLENIQKEVQIHIALDSPFIVKLHDFFVQDNFLYMIMTHIAKGNLYVYMYKHFPLSQEEALEIWFQTLKGIEYLHAHRIYMRDIKPENILIDADNSVKLCDFGWACRMEDVEYRLVQGGTYLYMSPESLRKEIQDLASDMWSLGVLLYELTHFRVPFKIGMDAEEQLGNIDAGQILFDGEVAEEVKRVVRRLLKENKYQRPNIKELLRDSYVLSIQRDLEKKGWL